MLEMRTFITEGGRLVIPASIRKQLNLKIGEEVILKVEFGELHISSYKKTIQNIQDKIKKYNKKNISLKAALLKDRKEESDHEE